MFRVKICGVTTIDDARAVADSGADAIGLNFFAKSPRCVALDQAAAIRRAVESLTVVGVFVNMPAPEIRRIVGEAGLSAVQLHGDEPPDSLAELDGIPVVRARRMGTEGVDPVASDLLACEAAGRRPNALLLDAASPQAYGGTGKTIDWQALAGDRDWLGATPLILAGGLKPSNVGEAIRRVGPFGVDTASGVESAPGVKDHQFVREFTAAALAAFKNPG